MGSAIIKMVEPGPDAETKTKAVRMLVADDHALFRRGFKLLLELQFPQAHLVEASDAFEAWKHLESGEPFDIVFLDLAMPGMGGIGGIRRFMERRPPAPVVILSAYAEPAEIIESLGLGARGYIPKSSSEDVLRHAVSLVLAGEVFMPSKALDRVVAAAAGGVQGLEGLEADNPLCQLTTRQRNTLALMIEGRSNKEIARTLGVLESTVKAQVKVILSKLDAQNRTQAARIATDLGWPRGPVARLP
ncbi:MAG: response regulator [Parvibaculaceae bacterium]